MESKDNYRILEERKDYIIYYNQYFSNDTYSSITFNLIVILSDSSNKTTYFDTYSCSSDKMPENTKVLENILRKSYRKLMRKMLKNRKK